MSRQPQQLQQPSKKSAYGNGTVYQRKDGRYVASTTNPDTGKRIARYARTEKEARQKLADIKYDLLLLSLREQADYLQRKLNEVNKQLAQIEADQGR